MTRRYRIAWDNGSACDWFPESYTSKREAEKAARAWKREMCAADSNPREARDIYQWEIVETNEEGKTK